MKTSHLKLPDIRFRVLSTVILVLLAVIIHGLSAVTGIMAEPELSRWHTVPLPRQGDIGGWVLAKGSDLHHLTIADDGTLYCSATGTGAPSRLFRSTDNGTSWRYTGNVVSITDIETVSGRPNLIYYSDGIDIFYSENKGISFAVLPHLDGVNSTENASITSFDVVDYGGMTTVVAGISDTDAGETGGVYLLTNNTTNPSWTDTHLAAYDVNAVSFSPYYSFDKRIFSVVNDENSTFVLIKQGTDDWSDIYDTVCITNSVFERGVIAVSAQTVAGSDTITGFLGLDSGNGTGDIYRVAMVTNPGISLVDDLNIASDYGQDGIDISSLVSGMSDSTISLIAGCADSGHIWCSNNEGQSWTRSLRPATGQGDTAVGLDSEGHICATTSGQGSAYSRSSDGGVTFEQVSLIDTEISSSCIMDMAPSPRYSLDTTMFLLTLDSSSMEYSLWRSVSADVCWERILGTSIWPGAAIKGIAIPPSYTESAQTVYLHGSMAGNPAFWRSDDNGRSFAHYDVPFLIDTWTIIDDDTLYIGCHDGTNSRVFATTDGGQSWTGGIEIGTLTLSSIERSPDYANDGTMFLSNLGGRVYYSDDGGYSYRTLPLDATSPPFSGKVMVKVDPLFGENGIVYAVSDAAGEGIYRFIIGESDEWERLDNSLPGTAFISDVFLTDEGVLYATNTDAVDGSADYGGLERSLNPSYHLFPSFESVHSGLEDGVFLRQSWISDNRIWSVDTFGDRLLTYVDTLTEPVKPVSPWKGEGDIDIGNAVLDWYGLEGTTEYEWQIDYDGSYSAIPSGFSGTTAATSVHLPDLDNDTRYFWRVRATEPVSSPWSERFSFVTGFSDDIICPELLFPEAGAELTSSKPLFQWGPIAGADKYELIVAAHNSFTTPSIKMTGWKALPGTAWQSETELDTDKVYYWKVRGKRSDSYSDWSAVGAFSIVTPGHTEHGSSLVGTEPPVLQALPVLLCPGYGDDPTDTRPLFQWDAVTGAECYELMVSTDAKFENPVIMKAGDYSVPISAWRCNIALEPDTAYYWKVRAVMNGSYGSWSPVSAFLVGDERADVFSGQTRTTEPDERVKSDITSVPTGTGLPEWAVFMGIGLLIVVAMLQIAILIALFMMRGKRLV